MTMPPPPGTGGQDAGDGPPEGGSYGSYPSAPSGPGPMAAGQGPVDHPQGTTILVLGILGLVVCSLLAPVAWYMGNQAQKEVRANPGRYANEQNIKIGRILGIIGTLIVAVALVIGLSIAVIAIAGGIASA